MEIYYSFLNEARLGQLDHFVVFYQLASSAKSIERLARIRSPLGQFTPMMTEGPFRDLIDSLEVQDYPQWEANRFFAFDPLTQRFRHLGVHAGRATALLNAKLTVGKGVRVVLDGIEATSSLHELEHAKVNQIPRIWADWRRFTKRNP